MVKKKKKKSMPAMWKTRFNPWIGRIPWRREQQPTPLFLPGEFHAQSSLVGYSPWGRKESDTTEADTLVLGCSRWVGTPRRILPSKTQKCQHPANFYKLKQYRS